MLFLSALAQLLSLAHDSEPPKLGTKGNPPAFNDPSLIRACEKDNYDLVKLFVDRGYRLRSLIASVTSWMSITQDE